MKRIIVFLFCVPFAAHAQNVSPALEKNVTDINPDVIAWRRHLHQHPELSNREYNTAAYVAAHLKKLGLEVQTGVGKTGVVGILKGGKPGPVIALRADMDALPVYERSKLAFASKDSADYLGQKVPVMHACGHDTHIAILMGTAEVLTKMKSEVAGTVKFIFQPAEEGPPGDEEGGAPLMIKEGVMDNPKVDVIFGLHIDAQTPAGQVRYTSGAAMAASDWFTIKVKGRSSHGSAPWSGIDPVVVSAQIINGLQTIVSRQQDITKAPVVITIGKIHGGVRNNIIPEDLVMDGTIRTLDNDMRKNVHEKIILTAKKIAEASGAEAEVSISAKTELTYNDPGLVKMMLPSIEKAAGAGNVAEWNWITGSEDFSYYSLHAPAFFFFLGGMQPGADPAKIADHHTPDFYIDDSKLEVGVKAFCQLVFDYGKLNNPK